MNSLDSSFLASPMPVPESAPRVLFLSTYYSGGGAAVAARRLLGALRAAGVEARMLVAGPLPPHTPSYIQSLNGWRRHAAHLLERIRLLPLVGGDRSRLFRLSPAYYGTDSWGAHLTRHPWIEWADVIHLHWVQQGMLSMSEITQITALPHKHIVWSLHDLWRITGGCHIPYTNEKMSHPDAHLVTNRVDGSTAREATNKADGRENTAPASPPTDGLCTQWRTGCHHCPLLSHTGSYCHSTSPTHRWWQAREVWDTPSTLYLGVSHRVTQWIEESPLVQHGCCATLPNAIDPTHFTPTPQRVESFTPAADRHALPASSPSELRLLFVAARPDDPIKGLDLCRAALQAATALDPSFAERVHFVCVGTPKQPAHHLFAHWPTRYTLLGNVTEHTLPQLYRAAHLTLSTSRFETFGQTLLESIACGTPAMAFDVGGISDIIDPDQGNGWLIPPFDTQAMGHALVDFASTPPTLSPAQIAATATPFHTTAIAHHYLALLHNHLSEVAHQ